MIAVAKEKPSNESADAIHDRFLSMLPSIEAQAACAFRGLPAEQREDLTAEVVANAFAAFMRLVERGAVQLAYPTPLARYAIAQARCGRRVGSKMNVKDVTSPYAQQVKQFNVERLDRRIAKSDAWKEIVVEDRKAGPAEVAATRIDFKAWLEKLPQRLRRVAVYLASGCTTKDAAVQFQVSPGRVSQLRRELMESWEAFHGLQVDLAAL